MAEVPELQARRSPAPFIVVGVVLAGLIAGAVVMSMTSAGAVSPRGATDAAQPGIARRYFEHRFGRRGFWLPLHGEFVVRKQGGGFQTIAMQRGSVTSVGPSSITLKSEDGYVHSYAIAATTKVRSTTDSIGDFKAGDAALVIATVSGDSATALRVVDISQIGERFGRPAPFGHRSATPPASTSF